MNRSVISLILFFLPLIIYAQVEFEAGYLIRSDGQRRELAIKNVDWRYTPERIVVREGSTTTEVATATLREFGIPGKARFIRYTLPAELSATVSGNLGDRPPRLEERQLLLRVEVEGPAILYGYYRPQVTKFFLRLAGDDGPTQLIYARWRKEGGAISESRQFVSQLNQSLDCGSVAPANRNTDYSLRDLQTIVQEYNRCRGAEGEVYLNNAALERRFRLNIAPGIYITRFRMESGTNQRLLFETDNQFLFRPGLEFEYYLPFGNNRVSLLFSPSYYRLEGAGDYSDIASPTRATVNYSILDLPVGARYRIAKRDRLSVNATALFGYGLFLSGEVAPDRGPPIEQRGTFSLSGGLGLQYGEFGLEGRYQRDGDFLPAGGFQSNTGGIRLMLFYSL
jgi:hypothetical protein